ncbi:tetratricopeptide repeat protein [Okeania hirsuta]|uniref:Tetratricopeptide repeat protein n=2 Tax=Okeania TaxID=1458928 RepID=A0A3N6PBY2_9CYAN|nr:tetratricopeptide repeat protein [Okeania hirsuta]RQH42227.1 tetratricopeptide repeat protein [Okeania hirsuta]
MKLKHWDAAINAYRKAIELNPNHPNNYYVLGKILEDKNQQNEAIVIYLLYVRWVTADFQEFGFSP